MGDVGPSHCRTNSFKRDLFCLPGWTRVVQRGRHHAPKLRFDKRLALIALVVLDLRRVQRHHARFDKRRFVKVVLLASVVLDPLERLGLVVVNLLLQLCGARV